MKVAFSAIVANQSYHTVIAGGSIAERKSRVPISIPMKACIMRISSAKAVYRTQSERTRIVKDLQTTYYKSVLGKLNLNAH